MVVNFFFDWFVNTIAGSPMMSILIIEAMYIMLLYLGKVGYHSFMMILGITLAIWMTTMFGLVWYFLFLVGSVVYLWFQIAKMINREQ